MVTFNREVTGSSYCAAGCSGGPDVPSWKSYSDGQASVAWTGQASQQENYSVYATKES